MVRIISFAYLNIESEESILMNHRDGTLTYSEILPSRFKSVRPPLPGEGVPACRIKDQTYQATTSDKANSIYDEVRSFLHIR